MQKQTISRVANESHFMGALMDSSNDNLVMCDFNKHSVLMCNTLRNKVAEIYGVVNVEVEMIVNYDYENDFGEVLFMVRDKMIHSLKGFIKAQRFPVENNTFSWSN